MVHDGTIVQAVDRFMNYREILPGLPRNWVLYNYAFHWLYFPLSFYSFFIATFPRVWTKGKKAHLQHFLSLKFIMHVVIISPKPLNNFPFIQSIVTKPKLLGLKDQEELLYQGLVHRVSFHLGRKGNRPYLIRVIL